jgi:ABC-type multidrug transport system fused ATPase/permease subunit
LIQNVSDVIKSTNVIFSYVNIVKDILLLIFILILIFKTLDFTYFLSLLLIFIPVLTLLLIIKNKIKNLGEVARDFRVATHKSLLESLTSIKFLQVSNTQKDFIQNFIKKLSVSQKGDFKLSIINLLPKSIIEISALLFIVTFMIYNSLGTGSFQSLLPSLSFIVIASIRIIPSLTQISININNIKYNSYTIPKVCHEIIYWNEKSNVALNIQSKNIIKEFKNSLKIENLNFSYVEDRTLIENFNLDIDKGLNVGITGESGVGKSTLIDLILGLIDPIKGEIICDKQNIKDDIFGWRNQVSFVPQDIVLLDTTIKENIILDFNYKKFNKKNYESALEISGLDNVIKKLKNADETDIGSFSSKISGGQKQRIGIARAIYLNRPIIILDESTNSLNNDAEEEIINNLLNSDYTIILISHNQKLINKCEKKVKL